MSMFGLSTASVTRLFDERLQQRLIGAVKIVLILLLAHALATLTWQLLPAPADQASQDIGPSQIAGARSDNTGQLTAELAGWHLFGESASKAAVETPTETTQVPLTRLQLTLFGVLASDDPSEAYAIIAGSDNLAHVYGIGDELPGQAVVNAIEADRVILERGGRLETLTLPKQGALNPATDDNTTENTASEPKGRLIDRRQDVRATALLNDFRNTLTSNPAELTQLVQVTPYQENGQFTGFRIQRVTGKARQLLRLGLRRGDVITSINGIPLDSPIRGLEVMNGLSTSTELQIEVQRSGEALSFKFAL